MKRLLKHFSTQRNVIREGINVEQTTKSKVSDAVRTKGLGKRYGSFWALKDCTINVPRGSVTALVGPNGAGKTSLLKLLVGLNSPSAGEVNVLGETPSESTSYLSSVGYLAQEIPLYNQFTASDHFAIGKHMDANWDNELAVKRLQELRIPLDRRVGKLSGGQRAQVGLAMALAKRPQLLLLDEPVAALDPLARMDFLTSLAQAVTDAEGELSVVMSSHLLADLERVCDRVIILAAGETQLCDDVDHVLKSHKLLVGPPGKLPKHDGMSVIKETRSATAVHAIVRLDNPKLTISGWHTRDVDVEEVVLAYMGQSRDMTADEGGKR
jgi:ABC-2 type transport system ATP-binding protein